MIQCNEFNKSKIKTERKFHPPIAVLMFLVGILNSRPYLNYMGHNRLTILLLLVFYILLVLMFMYSVLDFLYKGKKLTFVHSTIPYWSLLAIAVVLKFYIIFIQSPGSVLPTGKNFTYFLTHLGNVMLVIVLITNIYDISHVRKGIWAFGIGASFSAIIPLLFFPEMIGSRLSLVDDYVFSGAFWNSAVISYMSVGWLLIALLVNEKSKIKRGLLLGIFIILILASLAGLSRATLLSVVVSVLVYLLFSKNLVRYIRTIIVLIFISIVITTLFQDVIDNFERRLDGGINISDESRVDIWKDYIKDIPDYFILGELENNYKKYSITEHGPHSVVLNWFTQFGILALVGFFVLLFGLLKYIRKIGKSHSKHVEAVLYAWLAAYLSIALMNETGFKELSIYGGIGIILAWGNIINRRRVI